MARVVTSSWPDDPDIYKLIRNTESQRSRLRRPLTDRELVEAHEREFKEASK